MPDVSQTSPGRFISCQSKTFQQLNVLRTFVGFSCTSAHSKLKLNSDFGPVHRLGVWEGGCTTVLHGHHAPANQITIKVLEDQFFFCLHSFPTHLRSCSSPQAQRLHAASHGRIISSYALPCVIFYIYRLKFCPEVTREN